MRSLMSVSALAAAFASPATARDGQTPQPPVVEPWRFAAIAPVAGRGDPEVACALAKVPVWAFYGDRDAVVPPEGSFAIVRAIRACGGSPRLSIYPDLGHNAWDPAYDDPALYLWLLTQRNPVVRPTPKDKK